MKNRAIMLAGSLFISICCLSPASAASISNYCSTPPFIQESILPNMLMIIDNSASMYDLAYSDNGKKSCSISTTTNCTADSDCPSGQTCSNFLRNPYYCYDQTFSTANSYSGYFDSSKLYAYNFVTGEFAEDSSAFSCSAGGGQTAKSISGQLCVIYSTASPSVSVFKASGNYLNWLTASKFDIQKKILTGGKFNGTHLLAESRGCVGQGFVKEANSANFVNYSSPESNNPNTSLGITFTLRGPYDSINASAPSPGGQSYIEIFLGNYNQGLCQDAVTAIVSGGNADIKNTVEDCLASSSGTTAVTKTKVAFQQSMQACWQKREGKAIGTDDINTVNNQCPDIYSAFATCSNDPGKVCTSSTAVADCGSGNSCNYGPSAIVPGNAALLCGNEYEGQYFYYSGGGSSGTCSMNGAACTVDADCAPSTYAMCKKSSVVCTSDADCTASGDSCVTSPASKLFNNTCSTSATAAGWFLRAGVTTDEMISTHNQFCSDMYVPPVVDPTDAPSDTSKYDNVPAIISGVGVEAQLSQPIGTLTVRLKKTAEADGTITPPAGVISDFSSQIRIGAMSFNFTGSAAEASSGALAAPKVCSDNLTRVCTSNIDCNSSATCIDSISGTTNLDGGKIIHYIGTGHCSVTTSTVCYNNSGCPSGESCLSDGVGSYSSGLIKAINDVTANSWTPFSEAFYNAIGYFAQKSDGTSRTDLRLNTADFAADRNPSQYVCQANNILLISDGMSTADRNSSVDNLAKLYTAAGGSTSWTSGSGGCPPYGGSVNLDNMAWIGRNLDISSFSTTTASAAVSTADKNKNKYITTYVVFNGDPNGQSGECNSKTLLSQTASNGGTSLYHATDPVTLNSSLLDAFKSIASGVASGTAASILSNSDGTGANLLQAVFYPNKKFANNTEVNWIGEMQNLWYYVDPFLSNSTIREDTDYGGSGDRTLSLTADYAVRFYFDGTQTVVDLKKDNDGNGTGDTLISSGISPDDLKSIFRAGKLLWARSAGDRTVHTSIDGKEMAYYPAVTAPTVQEGGFSSSSTRARALIPYLQAADLTEAQKIINYVRGADQSGYRSRKVSILSSDTASEWKLGDIITSTPRLQTTTKLQQYSADPPLGYSDKSYYAFVNGDNYKNRGMVYVGANDGMMHAFKLGKLSVTGSGIGGNVKAILSGSDLGKEQWAYIPRNALPYLKYYADPASYKHIYYVDGPTVLVDAAIAKPSGCTSDYSLCTKDNSSGTNWGTLLIGSMGLGGASRIKGDSCIDGQDGTCVKTPIYEPVPASCSTDGCYTGEDSSKGVGYSSYFALDINGQYFNSSGVLVNQPTLKWEFTHPDLGFSTSGAAIVRVATKLPADAAGVVKPDTTTNGKWFAVFASGPTGAINESNQTFRGRSDQNLKLFVVDLGASGELVLNSTYWVIDTGIKRAFAGSLVNSTTDTDRWNVSSSGNYQDDVLYFGYSKANISDSAAITASTEWNTGGVIRLVTMEDPNPANWKTSTVVSGIGPVTGGISRLQDRKNHKLWLFFGSGRYFYNSDDNSGQRYILGVADPCYLSSDKFDSSCAVTPPSVLSLSDLENQTSTIAADIGSKKGWYIALDPEDTGNKLGAERTLTEPVALTNGLVQITTFKPTSDLCKFGGETYIWGVKYSTGAAPPDATLNSKVLLQVSTGSFEEVTLRTALTAKGGRRTGSPMSGKPPSDAPPVITNAGNKPPKKILHIQEK